MRPSDNKRFIDRGDWEHQFYGPIAGLYPEQLREWGHQFLTVWQIEYSQCWIN